MPELPEVETIARGLAERVTGETIESVWIGSKPEPLKSSAQAIARALTGARVERVHRAGKHIVVELASAGGGNARCVQWVVHLGMSGSLVVAVADHPVAKHTHLIARLRSGRELRFVDPRRFGRISIRSASPEDSSEWAGGAEPLEINAAEFAALLHRRQAPIKSALLNQKLLRGVGNIYADEALFRAGIRPRRRAATLSGAELQRLRGSLRRVLREAIAAGGSSISNYVDSAGEEGQFQVRHRVYGREGEACVRCGTAIKRVVLAGRSAHYCPKCQK